MGDEFPTDKAQMTTLRNSLFNLALSVDIPQPKRKFFYWTALQINNLYYKYRFLKEGFDDISFDLKRLRELQEKKSQFHDSYLALEIERKSILTRQKEIEDRTASLNTQLEAIKQEMTNLKTESTQLASQLATFSDQRLNLYAEATSLDHDILPLLSQKDGLESDFKIGSEGLAKIDKNWECLRQILVQATNPEDLVEPDPAVVGCVLDAEK
jgi:predicted  nucleic acid-binding Zn-ribbon protein